MKILIVLAMLIGSAKGQDRIHGDTLFIDHTYDLTLRSGIDTIIEKHDTIKWKPYYLKKKPSFSSGIGIIGSTKSGKVVTSDMRLIVKGNDVKLGGPLVHNTAIDSSHIWDVKHDKRGELVVIQPYPWYKKAAFSVLGAIILAIVEFIITLFIFAKADI